MWHLGLQFKGLRWLHLSFAAYSTHLSLEMIPLLVYSSSRQIFYSLTSPTLQNLHSKPGLTFTASYNGLSGPPYRNSDPTIHCMTSANLWNQERRIQDPSQSYNFLISKTRWHCQVLLSYSGWGQSALDNNFSSSCRLKLIIAFWEHVNSLLS